MSCLTVFSITPPERWQGDTEDYNVESCTIDPANPNHMFMTTETNGLWSTSNLSAAPPTFVADPDYPFAHPMRVFFNPYKAGEVWVASFGGGLRVRTYRAGCTRKAQMIP
ncbi:MAG: hypothetical protein WCG85_25620 [Polyangia bacterium]